MSPDTRTGVPEKSTLELLARLWVSKEHEWGRMVELKPVGGREIYPTASPSDVGV